MNVRLAIGMVAVLILLIVGAEYIRRTSIPNTERDTEIMERPKYCDNKGCVPEVVFSNLPEMPKDFLSKWGLVYYGRISNMNLIPEEYWKQPEFYGYTFKEQCLQYYTILETQKNVMFFSAGSGPYPADSGATNVTRGQDLNFTTFWHTGCAIARYQVFAFDAVYPETMKLRNREISVNQNPETTKQCFQIRTDPEYMLLSPNYPIFRYNHTQKLKLNIHVNEDCPPGEYGLLIIPVDPPQHIVEMLEMEYGWSLSSMRTGGSWQIYIKVEN